MRRDALAAVLEDALRKDIHPKRSYLLEAMRKKGHPVSVPVLYADMTALNRGNTFVRDLTESNYSAYIEEIYRRLQWVEAEAERQYGREWTTNQRIIRVGPQGEETETHITEEQAQPKAQFLALIAKTQELKHKILVGDTTQLSAALLSEKFQSMKEELETLKRGGKLVEKLAVK